MKKNIVREKSFAFSVRIVRLYKWLCAEKREYIMSKQLLRSGTSIGANVQEAQAAQTKKDFITKMSIASKEAGETMYWIKLLMETGYLDHSKNHVQTLLSEIEEIVRILTKIVKTSQTNND